MKPILNGELYDKIQEIKERYADYRDTELLMNVFERTKDITIQEVNQMEVLLFRATHEEQYPLTSGGNCFIVSYRGEKKNVKESLQAWLSDKGYKLVNGKHYDLGYMYVNIDTKVYRYGMPGISFGKPIGGKIIEFYELKKIAEILED